MGLRHGDRRCRRIQSRPRFRADGGGSPLSVRTEPPFRLPVNASIAQVHLRIADLDRSLEFYAGILGLAPVRAEASATLSGGERPIIELSQRPGTVRRPDSVLGIYHIASLYRDRPALGHAMRRLIDARWPFTGFADHGVSEAAYLADPDGIGVELYADRPRADWPRDASGSLVMYTRALDTEGLLALASGRAEEPGGERIGHIHLHVAELAKAEAFYAGQLGFDVVQRSFPGALFLSAGGYHHHVGLNTWARGRMAEPDAAGLLDFSLAVPDRDALPALAKRVGGAPAGDRFRTTDPDGNAIVVTAG